MNSVQGFTPVIRYSMALPKENWCIDYTIYPPADANMRQAINYRAMAYRESNADLMRTAYPGVTKQNEPCEVLGYISPLQQAAKNFKQEKQLGGVMGYTFVAKGNTLEGKGSVVSNAFWTKPKATSPVMLI